MTSENRVRQAPIGKLLRLAWKLGGPTERLFVVLIYLVVLAVVILFWTLAVTHTMIPLSAVFVVIVWGFLIGFFQQAFLRPMYTPRALREIARLGYGPQSGGQYLEVARFVEDCGIAGHLPGDVAWGLAYWGAFYTLLLSGVGFTILVPGVPAVWAVAAFMAAAVPVGFLLWRAYAARVARFYDEAERKGYRVRTSIGGASPFGPR